MVKAQTNVESTTIINAVPAEHSQSGGQTLSLPRYFILPVMFDRFFRLFRPPLRFRLARATFSSSDEYSESDDDLSWMYADSRSLAWDYSGGGFDNSSL